MRKLQRFGVMMMLLLLPGLGLAAKGGPNSGATGKENGSGAVLGDLIHIKRDAVSGQPILQKRWIEYPQDILGWGYCPIAVDENGNEIGFMALSCDPIDPTAVVEVDYFGRLSASRTKERNQRMHFDEVISNIKAADSLRLDVAGRLELGFNCTTPGQCDWATIDSPMENLALYTRLMTYGHIQTDPHEIDTFEHGDPAAGTRYHPALDAQDWAKFRGVLKRLLPLSPQADPTACFGGNFSNGFNNMCSHPEALSNQDLITAAAFLGGASGKTGKITVDLLQYLNRILKITQETELSAANLETLPALIRDCGNDPEDQTECHISAATADLPAPANERFVNFASAEYSRYEWRNQDLNVIIPAGAPYWMETSVALLDWLTFVNGTDPGTVDNISGFVDAANDSLRTIEFIHNYAIPEDLGWDFQ